MKTKTNKIWYGTFDADEHKEYPHTFTNEEITEITKKISDAVNIEIEKFKYVISMTKFCSHLTEYKCNRHPGYIRLLPTQGISTINSILDSLI